MADEQPGGAEGFDPFAGEYVPYSARRRWRHFDPILGFCTIEETDERVSTIGRRIFRFRAQALADRHPPLIESYSLRIEKVPGVPCLYEVVAYQNRIIPG